MPPSKPVQNGFRVIVKPRDADAVERLVGSTGVFSTAEIAIARELVEQNLAKGAELSGYHFLFADGPDGLMGYACFGPIPATAARFELYWIAVKPDAHRTGLGARLQSAVEERSRGLGAKYLIAETSTTDLYSATRRFYCSMGYSHLADIPFWHADDDGLAVFGKPL
jgi:GNAT superfamily N-acetyltransferase